ncbi:MAG: S9 family peptidase [Gammaproteobacteria bacterium]|nr:MAG: S9 family peptidase [Gammaproteobacteria bacterium]
MSFSRNASLFFVVLLGAGLVACGRAPQEAAAPQVTPTVETAPAAAFDYPRPRDGGQVDDYFGIQVADPYRWMEDDDSAEVKAWVEAENAIAMPYLRGLPGFERIKDRLTELWDYERFSIPEKEGARYFFRRNDGLQDQDVLYVADSHDAEPRMLIDPNTFSEDRTTSMPSFSASPDGKLIAYNRSEGGSDWDTWHIRDVDTGEDFDDRVAFTKFTGASWSRDSQGFYYSRYPESEDGAGDDSQQVRIYYHIVGTDQAQDEMIYAITDHETRNPYATVTEDGAWLIIGVFDGYDSNGVYYQSLSDTDADVMRLLDDWDALYSFLGNVGSEFYFQTNFEAPNRRVIAIDTENPGRENWREVVAEQSEAIQDTQFTGGHIVVSYLKDARSMVRIFDPYGEFVREVELPGIGTVGGFDGHMDDPETFYSFTGFTDPSTIYRYDIETGETALFRKPEVAIDLSQFQARQVFYESKDGTRVPMFIVHKGDVVLDGNNPVLLYGYGGFNISLTPAYSTSRLVWMEMGGVFAMPNLRGGDEYGENWHKAGTRLDKQNVFDDFIAAAEYLIDEGWTSTPKLAIQGRSNGGLLVGAVMTQRPELFGVALPGVGVLDMLRYHTASANARQWSSDYGLSENEDEFKALFAYSPYHNVVDGTCYPPTLVTTADHDDRVVPWNSFKFGAALQAAQGCDNPVIVRIETRAGHGAGKPTWMRIEDIVEHWAFTAYHLGMNLE